MSPTDPLSQTFEDLVDEYYPGSKQKRREGVAGRRERMRHDKKVEAQNEEWDARPFSMHVTLPDGREFDIEMFYIGSLGKALHRRPVTIRSWITKGWIPQPRYKTRAIEGTVGDAGRRLWTRRQIEGLITVATEEGLLDIKPPFIQDTNFIQRVKTSWREWSLL